MTPNEYIDGLSVGCDVDWLKTNPGRTAYQKARAAGKSVPQMFRDRGFDHVRLRVQFYDMPIDEMQDVVDDCLAADLTPILAFQGQHFKDAPNAETQEEHCVWWEDVALAFKDYPEDLAFNLLIETTDAVRKNPKALNDLYAECAPRVLAINSDRVLIVPPCGISAPEYLDDLVVPLGCVAEAHFYAAGPSKTNLAKLWIDGTEFEKALINDKIKLMTDWRSQTGVNVWLGAIMFADFNSDETDSMKCSYTSEDQAEFARFVGDSLKAADIPFAVNSDTKFFDREKNEWRPEQHQVLNQILPVKL